jgi:hypothetical protein
MSLANKNSFYENTHVNLFLHIHVCKWVGERSDIIRLGRGKYEQ